MNNTVSGTDVEHTDHNEFANDKELNKIVDDIIESKLEQTDNVPSATIPAYVPVTDEIIHNKRIIDNDERMPLATETAYTLIAAEPVVAVDYDPKTFFYKDSTNDEVKAKTLVPTVMDPEFIKSIEKRFIMMDAKSKNEQMFGKLGEKERAFPEESAPKEETAPEPTKEATKAQKSQPEQFAFTPHKVMTFKIETPTSGKLLEEVSPKDCGGDEAMARYINDINNSEQGKAYQRAHTENIHTVKLPDVIEPEEKILSVKQKATKVKKDGSTVLKIYNTKGGVINISI